MDCSWAPEVNFDDLRCQWDDVISDGKVSFKWEKLCEIPGKFAGIDVEVENYSIGKGSGIISAVCNSIRNGIIRLFDAFGQEYEPIHVKDGNLRSLFCQALSDDSIVVISSDLKMTYYQQGKCVFKQNFTEFNDASVELVAFDPQGNAVILLEDGRLLHFVFHCAQDKSSITLLNHIDTNSKVRLMTLMQDSEAHVTAFLVCESGDLVVVSNEQTPKYNVRFENKIELIACSNGHSCIAILFDNDELLVSDVFLTYEIYRTSLAECYLSNPRQMTWIGDTTPLVGYESGCVLGTDTDSHPFWVFDSPTVPLLFGDIDCALIITENGSYRLLELPACVMNVISDEHSEGYKLCNAFNKRFSQPPESAVRHIRLSKACEEIGEAAPYLTMSQVSGAAQSSKKLLETCKYQMFMIDALIFGSKYCRSVNPEYVIRKITVINMLFFIGKIAITSRQIDEIGFKAVVRRLCARGHHFLAVKLSEMIGITVESVSRDYVQYTIDRIPEDRACKVILTSEPYSDIGYAVGYALRNNRRELARILCEECKNTPKRAMLFAQMGDWSSAFKTVSETGNMDELYGLFLLISSLSSRNVPASLLSSVLAESEMAVRYLVRCPEVGTPEMMTSVLSMIDDTSSFADVKTRYSLKTKERETISPELDTMQRGIYKVADFLHDDSVLTMTRNQLLRKLIFEENQEALRLFVDTAEIPREVVDAFVSRVFADKSWERFTSHAVGKGIANVELAIHIALARKQNAVVEEILQRIEKTRAADIRHRIEIGEFAVTNAKSFTHMFSYGGLISKVAGNL